MSPDSIDGSNVKEKKKKQQLHPQKCFDHRDPRESQMFHRETTEKRGISTCTQNKHPLEESDAIIIKVYQNTNRYGGVCCSSGC